MVTTIIAEPASREVFTSGVGSACQLFTDWRYVVGTRSSPHMGSDAAPNSNDPLASVPASSYGR